MDARFPGDMAKIQDALKNIADAAAERVGHPLVNLT